MPLTPGSSFETEPVEEQPSAEVGAGLMGRVPPSHASERVAVRVAVLRR